MLFSRMHILCFSLKPKNKLFGIIIIIVIIIIIIIISDDDDNNGDGGGWGILRGLDVPWYRQLTSLSLSGKYL